MMMEETCREQKTQSTSSYVFEIPGEPAIVIDGLPALSPFGNALISIDNATELESEDCSGFGEWLVGREVSKMFGDQYYSGKVVKFDQETNWYRVVYEDNDFEDLEWCELQEVLLPLDIAIPLKALALKMCKFEKYVYSSGEHSVKSRKKDTKNVTSKRKTGEEDHRILVIKSEGSGQIKENEDYGRTTRGMINRPREIRRTINAEKQKRKTRNAVKTA